MAKARIIKQAIITTPNEVGTLAKLTSAVKQTGINITHLCAYVTGEGARFMVATDNPDEVIKLAQGFGYAVSLSDVLEVEFENRQGSLAPVAKQIAEAGIDINYIYGTTGDGTTVVGVISTDNNQKVLELING